MRSARKILLVEPGYKNKFPPLGLMKIASYHRLLGDHVYFIKGEDRNIRSKIWDRIYITTLFTFFWEKTIKTIRYYSSSVNDCSQLFIGGILATLMEDELINELLPEIRPTIISGVLDKPGMLDVNSRIVVEDMIPNYSILEDIAYRYDMNNCYLGYATRGCVNKCDFCAVKRLEPKYNCIYNKSVLDLVKSVDNLYGQKKDLVLLDNNIFASPDYNKIITDILDAGFVKGARLKGRKRNLDFNQGLDARLISKNKVELLAKTSIRPIRLAFDNSNLKRMYEDAIRMTCDYGLLTQSSYILYNFKDTPEDFYNRIRFNILLNKELGCKISSFPMKYIPLNAKDRSFIGKHWHRKIIRGLQCILLATKGIVSPNPIFFDGAFGRTYKEFIEICMMPEHYIIWRQKNAQNALEWKKLYRTLSTIQKVRLFEVLSLGKIKKEHYLNESGNLRLLFEHYIENY